MRFSRTFGDGLRTVLTGRHAALRCQAALSTRALNSSKPALPYICRLIVFTCWTDYTNRHTPYLGRYSRCACAFSDHSPEPGKLAPATSGGQTEGSTMSRATRKRHLPASASPSLS